MLPPTPSSQSQERPGLFGRIGNFFGADDPNAGTPTDPFANLSRAQRTMLGFAALRDAAASLEGRDSSFFNEALGGFEQARERERLRAQGEFANRNQQMMNLIQMQALARAVGDPTLEQFASDQLATIMGGADGVTPAVGGGATPMETPVDFTGGTLPADLPSGPQGVTGPPPTGVVYDDAGTVAPAPYTGEAEPVAPPAAVPAEPVAPAPRDNEVARLQAQRAELVRRLAASDVANIGTASINQQIEDIDSQLARLATETQTAEAEVRREERTAPLIAEALDFLVNDDGSINVLGSFLGATAPMFAGRQARSAIGAIEEMAAVQALGSVAEARAQGYTGTLTDADIELITRSGGTFDPMQPERTVATLERLAPQLSRQAQNALFGGQVGAGGASGFTPTDADRSLVEGYLR